MSAEKILRRTVQFCDESTYSRKHWREERELKLHGFIPGLPTFQEFESFCQNENRIQPPGSDVTSASKSPAEAEIIQLQPGKTNQESSSFGLVVSIGGRTSLASSWTLTVPTTLPTARSVLRPYLVTAEFAIPILIERLQRLSGTLDFLGGNHTILVGIKCANDWRRSHARRRPIRAPSLFLILVFSLTVWTRWPRRADFVKR